MLGEMARKTDQLAGERQRQRQPAVGGIEAQLARPRRVDAVLAPAPHALGQRRDRIAREAHRLPDLADRGTRAVADHGRGEAGAVAPVFPVDVLDHLLAPLMLEVDVDVGRLVAGGADEALEQEIAPRRIDGGDAEAIADGRVGGGAAPLAEDVLRAGEADDVLDGEEIGRIAEPGDEGKLVVECRRDLLRHALGIAPVGAEAGEPLQLLLCRAAVAGRLVGIFEAELVEAEAAGLGDRDRAGDRFGMVAEETRHLRRRLQMPLGVGGEAKARLVDGAMLADAGEHVLQGSPRRIVHVHVVGGDERRAFRGGESREPGEAAGIVAAIEIMAGEKGAGREASRNLVQKFGEGGVSALRRQRDDHLTLSAGEEIGRIEMAFPLGRAPAAERDELRQPAIGGPIGRQAQHALARAEVEPRCPPPAGSSSAALPGGRGPRRRGCYGR